MIDLKNWKNFPLTELFIVTGTKTTAKNKLELDEINNFPYITTAGTNNGVSDYSSMYTEEGNVLTVDSAVLGSTFFQKDNFTASDHVEKLIPKFTLTENIALFIASVMNGTARLYGYAYNEKRSQTALKREVVPLPTKDGMTPDFEFMETYINDKKSELYLSLNNLISLNIDRCNSNLDIFEWRDFHLFDNDLFEIDMGTKLDKSKMTIKNPTINFVGRANANNGVTTCVDRINEIVPYKAGNLTLSLGGEYLGSCFVQEKDFYTSQNVVVLKPRWNMPLKVKQFIATMIFKESRTYYKAFIDELNRHIKKDFTFKLPVQNNGQPDFNFMIDYMSKIEEKMKTSFNSVINI